MSYMCLNELVLEKRWLEALQAFHRYEKTSGGYQWHRSQADIFHGQILKECGQLRDALAILTRPVLASSRAEALHLAIEIAVELGMDAASVSSLRQQALTLRVPMETGMSGNPQIPYVIDRTKYT
jgi:hypothetical protein